MIPTLFEIMTVLKYDSQNITKKKTQKENKQISLAYNSIVIHRRCLTCEESLRQELISNTCRN